MKTIRIHKEEFIIVARYRSQAAARKKASKSGLPYKFAQNPRGRGWLVVVPRIDLLPV